MGVTKEERARRLADIRVMSDAEFACKYAITEEWAKKLRQRHGIYCPKVPLIDTIPEEVKRRVCALRREGKNLKQIRIETNVSDWGVREILHANGFEVYRFKGKKKKKRPPRGEGESGGEKTAVPCVTPETAMPFFYGGRRDTFEFNEPDRRRFEELKQLKEAAFRRGIEDSEFRDETLRSLVRVS